jgi:hypothetical protein
MPITLNHSNIGVQYNTGSNYIIETVKSDLYLRDTRTDITSNLLAEPTVVSPVFTESIRTFAHSGGTEAQTTYSITVARNTICDILVVGGGGGGGSRHGGGGGAGAVIYSTNITLTAGTYTIGVGKGGTGKVGGDGGTTSGQGNKGEDSSISFNSTNIYLAKGGGAGNHGPSSGNSNKDGGSGGGGGDVAGFAVSTNIPSGTYGNSGGIFTGAGGPETYAGGGGGGAGSSGNNATNVSGIGRSGNGGNGIQISITDTNVYYGGGGGGGTYTDANNIAGTGGLGGGGAGSKGAAAAISGTAGTGGGGGGGGFSSTTNGSGGSGGSGIVIIKFKSLANPITEGNPITHKRLNFVYNSDNLVAWYKFNGDYLDSSGNGHNLTNVGTVIQSTQVIEGQAVEFDSTDYLEFPASINPYTIWNGKGISFSCWVRFTAHETWERLFEFQPAVSTNSGIRFSIKSVPAGNCAINISVGSTEFNYSDWNNTLITNLNVWRHLVFCVSSSGIWDVYLDNVRINGTETANIPNITYNFRFINRSAYVASSDGTWDGQMDDFRIYDRALSAADVSLLYNKTYSIPPNIYTLNFPVPTIADINNNSNIVLRGAYDISLSTTNSSIIPKSGQYIIPPTTFSTPTISIRYNLLNPTLDPIGAQWTYNSSNTNVYHMGNVGIGTKSPEYNLDVRGFIHTSVGGYTQTGSENWIIQSDRRIKENIVKASYEKCLENVKNIELYNFNFKDNCVNTNDRHQLGFIAQEVQQVYPKAVEVGKIILDNNQGINDLLTLNTTQIKYTLYGAVKNLIERVENIESRVEQIYNMTLSSNFKSPSSNISISIINASNMTANTSNIATNTLNINTSNVATNTSNITANTSNIVVSTSNIAVSTSNIAVSTSNIAVSTSNVATNTSNVSVSTSNIAVSTSNIATNTSNIAVSTSNVSVNTSNIAVSTSNISVSTSNINTSNIDTSNIDTSNV